MLKVCLLLFVTLVCNAQDSIVFLNRVPILGKVEEINGINVRYFESNSLNNLPTNASKKVVSYVRYADGIKVNIDSLCGRPNCDVRKFLTMDSLQLSIFMFQKGSDDAKRYYKSKAGSPLIGVTGCVTSVFGIIPTIIVAAAPPQEKNLGYPKESIDWLNLDYQKGYKLRAHMIKKQNIWRAYGFGVLFATSFVVAWSLAVAS